MTSIQECKHGLLEDECHVCKNPERVFRTGGGSKYHWFRDCDALDRGQDEALVAGLKLHDKQPTTKSAAIARGRTECRTCRRRKTRGR